MSLPVMAQTNVGAFLSETGVAADATLANPGLNLTVGDTGSLFLYLDTEVNLLGVPLDVTASTAGVIQFTGITLFNPYLDDDDPVAQADPDGQFDLAEYEGNGGNLENVPAVRWAGTGSSVTAHQIDRATALAIPGIVGYGLDTTLTNPSGVLFDPLSTPLTGAGRFLFAEITYQALTAGSTDLYISVTDGNDLNITPTTGTPSGLTVQFGAGESTTTNGLNGSGVLGTSGNFLADAVITVSDVSTLLGDYNNDGLVGSGDLGLVLSNWGAEVADGESPSAGWINAATVTASNIGSDELSLVLSNWGNTASLEAEFAAITQATGLRESQIISLVPEPGSALLVFGGAVLLLARRKLVQN